MNEHSDVGPRDAKPVNIRQALEELRDSALTHSSEWLNSNVDGGYSVVGPPYPASSIQAPPQKKLRTLQIRTGTTDEYTIPLGWEIAAIVPAHNAWTVNIILVSA